MVEKLIEYVTNQLPTRDEMYGELSKKADKKDIRIILSGQDKIIKELHNIRTEQVATNSALLRNEERIKALEEK